MATKPEQLTEQLAPAPTPPNPPEKEKDYVVKAGCAIEHNGTRYEGNADSPVKVRLTEAEAEVHRTAGNLE